MLLTVVIDIKQPCSKKLNTDMNMTMTCIVDCSAVEADGHACESRVTSGLKHRWRWKQYELLYRADPGTDLWAVL